MENDLAAVKKEENERFARIFRFMPDALIVVRVDDDVVLEVNEEFGRLSGYGPEHIVGKPLMGFVLFLDTDLWVRSRRMAMEQGDVSVLETRLRCRDGRVVFARMNSRIVEIDGVSCHVAAFHEVSRHHFTEKAPLSRAEETSPPLDMDSTDFSGEGEDGNPLDFHAFQNLVNSFYKITGIGLGLEDDRGVIRVSTGWQDVCLRFHRIHPETLANCSETDSYICRNVREGKRILIKCGNGMWDMATPLVIDGRHIATLFLGQFFFDDELPDYVFFRNQARRYGFDEEEYMAALERVPRWSRESVANVMDFYENIAELFFSLNLEVSQARIRRKTLEDELILTRFCIDNAGTGILQTMDERIFNANTRACRSLGYTVDELRAMTVFDIDPVATMEKFLEIMGMLEATGSVTHQSVYRRRDGTTFPVEITTNLVEFNGGKHAFSFFMDITERKQAEEALLESEQKFRVLAETAPAAIVVYQGDRFVYVNSSAVGLFGYDEDELLGMKFWQCAHPDCRAIIRERGFARQRGEAPPGKYEHRFVKKGGEEGWVMVSAGTFEYGGKLAGIATFIDITESKHAEERMRAVVEEKVLLLKELHHRVKNNLQIISTLLDLQSESVRDAEALNSFRESQNRIAAMALIHEMLYASEDFSSVDFADYIEGLSLRLFDSYSISPGRIGLKVESGCASIGIDRAIPCALIINELVSNALKYAFPDNRHGEISIRFDVDEDGRITMAVADNGVGLPPGLDFRNTASLGLQLVTMLTRQLRGEVEVSGAGGTIFTITFPWSNPE